MKTKRFLSALLSLVMVFSLITPTTAIAAGKASRSGKTATDEETIVTGVTGGTYTDTTASADESYEYTITGSDGSEATVAVLAEGEEDTSTVVEQIDSYVRIATVDELVNGTYVMTGARSGANLNLAILSDTSYSGELTVSDAGVITSEINDNYLWTITAVEDGYTIQNSDSRYLYINRRNSAADDAVQTRAETYTMTIAEAVDDGYGTGVAAGSFNIGGMSVADDSPGLGYLNHRSDNGICTWNDRDIGSCIYLYKHVVGYKVTDTAIAAATSGVQGKAYYTEDSYEAYRDALAAAKETYGTEAEAVAAYDALVAAVAALEDSGLEAVTFNTSNNNISWQRTDDTKETDEDGTVTATNYVSNIPYVNSAGSYTYEGVTYDQYTALTWNWSSLNRLINDQDTKVNNVWSTQTDGMSACKYSENSATNWAYENFYKISGTFAWPEDYDLSDTTISIASVNDDSYSGIYDYIEENGLSSYFDGDVIPVNDDVYVVMWVDDDNTSITADNINDYLLFWTGTSGKGIWTRNGTTLDDWARTTPATFLSAMKQGVRAFRNAWPNAVGAQTGLANTDVVNNTFSYMTHTDGWYTITDTSAINSVMRNNYDSITAGATVHLDLYVANNDGEGMIDELEVTLTKKKVTEADVTVMYYYNEVSEDTYLGSSVMTNQTIGSTITLTGGTNASQLDYLKSAATAATKKEMNSGVQLNTITVQKDSSQNIIRVLYTAGDAKVIYLTAPSDTVAYDGNSHTLNTVAVTESSYDDAATALGNGKYTLPDGNTLENVYSVVTATDPGKYPNNFTTTDGSAPSYIVRDSSGNDVTGTYTFVKTPGTLTITYDPAAATYTYDFGVTNKYAGTLNAVEQKATVTESSDEVEVNGADVTYTPAAADTGDSVDLTLTFTGNYQVTKNVTFVPATNVLYEENLVTDGDGWTLIDDTFEAISSDPTLPVVDDNDSTVYGYTDIDAYAASEGFSNGSAYQAAIVLGAGETTAKTNGASTFTFTGTGFDLISECGTDTGMLLVKVSDSAGKAVAAYLADTYFTGDGDVIDAETSEDSILDYQVPVIRNMALPYGTYTVTVYGYLVNTAGAVGAASAASYGLTDDEADTAESASSSGISAEDIVAAALDDLDLWDELDVEDVEVSFISEDSVLNGGYGNTAAAGASNVAVMTLDDEGGAPADGSDVTAYVYIDGFRVYKPLETDAEIYTTDKEAGVSYYSVYDFIKNSVTELEEDQYLENAVVYVEYDGEIGVAAIKDYKTQGPQNEVYLTPGSGIAFALDGYKEGSIVQIAAKCVGGDYDASNIAEENANIEIAPTATEMYYTVTPQYDEENDYWYVAVTNGTDATSILALSGLKVSRNVTAWASAELGEKVVEKLDKSEAAAFTPKVLTVSASSSVKSGRNLTISVQSSVDDVDHVTITQGEGEETTLTATNTKLVAAGKSDVYKYSYTFKTKGYATGEYTFTIYAYDAEGNQSAPVTVTITVTK